MERSLILRIAFGVTGVSAALLPIAVRSAHGAIVRPPAPPPHLRRIGISRVAAALPDVGRDPFSSSEPAAAGAAIARLPAVPLVTAIAAGADARALVREAAGARIVAEGDALAGSTIVRIDPRGILLRDGRVLTLEGPTP